MLALYTVSLLSLVLLRAYCRKKATGLYARFEKSHEACQKAATKQQHYDPITEARNRTKLDRQVEQMTNLEDRYETWSERAQGLATAVSSMLSWRGRKFPYVLGFLDSTALLGILDHFGLNVMQYVKNLF